MTTKRKKKLDYFCTNKLMEERLKTRSRRKESLETRNRRKH